MLFYYNLGAFVQYDLINRGQNLTERNVLIAGRQEFAKFGVLRFIGGRVLCSLSKNLFCLICNILYYTEFFFTDYSLHILFVALRCIDPSRCFTLRKINNLPRILLNLLFIF